MPDLNSLPPSRTASRRQSQTINAGPIEPHSPSLNILPSNQGALGQGHSGASSHQASAQAASPQLTSTQPMQAQQLPGWMSNDGVGAGPGPARHPRAMTNAEMHAELEKEQEAVVNRLTRELSLLRAAQNASVVSNSSSTSAANSTHEPHESSLLSGSGFTIPTARRHNRTSSVTSNPTANLSSSLDARGSTHPANPRDRSMSRQNSTASRRSRGTSPAPGSLAQGSSLDPIGYFQSQRHPPPSSLLTNASSGGATPADHAQQLSPGLIPGTTRYEETATHRAELDAVKRENEALKRKVRELERRVRERRASDASRSRDGRGRSDSVSTSASVAAATAGVAGMGIAGPREGGAPRETGQPLQQRPDRSRSVTMQSGVSVGVGVPDEEVKVGESAASGTNVSRG